jgi:hypothetical protein
LGFIAFVVLGHLPSSIAMGSGAPRTFVVSMETLSNAHWWLKAHMPDPIVEALTPWLNVEPLAWTLALACLAVLMLELALEPAGAAAPFDSIAESPRLALRAAWLALALTVVCLVALPTFLISGQVLLHIRVNAEDLAGSGWRY